MGPIRCPDILRRKVYAFAAQNFKHPETVIAWRWQKFRAYWMRRGLEVVVELAYNLTGKTKEGIDD